MEHAIRDHGALFSAYAKAMRRSNWYLARSLPWPKRLWRHPLLTLRYALIDRFWKIAIALRLHGPFLTARTFWGDRMQVVFPGYRSVYHHGLIDGRELPVQNFLVQFLKEGDVCLDVGANIGFYTLLASALVGESGRVYAFEPTPRTFNILTTNSDTKKNVVRVNAALMDAEGKKELADYGAEMSGLNTMFPSDAPRNASVETHLVQATTLDAYCKSHDIRPTFIKIDTEGAEEAVLLGGRQTLAAHHPVLVIEVQREAPLGVVAFLAALGYEAYQFIGNVPVPYVRKEALACPNMLFMRGEP